MAKKVTDTEYRRMMSTRQERIGGRFGTLKPQFRPQAVTPASEATPEPPQLEAAIAEPIGLPQGDVDKGALALVLEAQRLAGDVATADNKEAQKILAKIKVIRELAKKAKGDQAVLSAKLDSVISPIQDELKRKASFRGFLKEKAEEFRKTLPERIASRIPVVGGVVGGFLRQRRESEEELQRYSRDLMRGKGKRDGFADLGGTAASNIPGLGMGGGKNTTATLAGIYKEITKIRTMLESRFSPESDSSELKAREAELEGKGAGIVKKAIGGKDGEKKGGILSSILGTVKDFLGSTISTMLGSSVGKRVMSMAGGAARLAGSAVRGTGRLISSGVKAVGGFAAKAGSAIANTGVGKAVGSAASKAGGFFGNMFGKAKDIVGSLNPIKSLSSGIKSSAGKIGKAIVSLPGLGALITAAMGAFDIGSIKNDPNLSADQKKEHIGKTLVGTLGSALGGIGGGALGTALGPLGTIAGSIGGAYLGELVANSIAEAIGPKGIYDLVESIPGVGSLISVGDTKAAEEAAKITAPASPNTTVGKMVSQYSAEQSALGAAKAEAAAGTATAAPTVNNSAVNTRVSNITNNFNDDLKIRNNEPTLKTMQFRTVQM